MMTIYGRAANDLDVKALTDDGQGSPGRNLATVSFPVAAIAFGIVYSKWRSALAAGIFAMGLFLVSLLSNIRFFRAIKRRKNMKKDANALEVLEVSASSVLELEPLGDDAPAFCFFVGEGKALLLVGQWLLKYHSFPAESFRLHRWADTKKPIRIDAIERPVDAAISKVRLRPSHRYGKIEVLDAALETLQADLDQALGRGSAARVPR